MTAPLHINELALHDLPTGALHRIWLDFADDGMGRPAPLPLLVVRGRKPGPTVGITAAVHGDEVNGIRAIQGVLHGLDPKQLAGTVVAVLVVNVPGLLAGRRLLDNRSDLNHAFPGNHDGPAAQQQAARLLDRVVRHVDVLIDLHTASRGRANALYVRADLDEPRTRRLTFLQRPQIVVHNPPSDGTLRGAAADLGIPAITVEIGDAGQWQSRYIRRAASGLRAVLSDLKMLPRRKRAPVDPPVVCSSSSWLFTDRGGLLEMRVSVAERVQANQEIARMVDVFGDLRFTTHAPYDAVVVGHAVDPIAPTGARIVHLGLPAPADHPHCVQFTEEVSWTS